MSLTFYKRQKISGFTIIEVMIALAIAGLIMVVVFIAISQVQANQRDSQRKDYAARAYESLLEFYKNNRKIPACSFGGACAPGSAGQTTAAANSVNFLDNYLPEGTDPSTGREYKSTTAVPSSGESYIRVAGVGGSTACPNAVTYFFNPNHIHQGGRFTSHISACDPFPGTLVFAAGNHCFSSSPDGGPNINQMAVRNDKLDKFLLFINLEKGGWFCLDNYSG